MPDVFDENLGVSDEFYYVWVKSVLLHHIWS